MVRRWFRSGGPSSAEGASQPASSFGASRNPSRTIAFSDAVFAIAVTLLVLDIRPPNDFGDLFHALAALWPSYLAYAITFLLIGQVWVNHHVMFDYIQVVDRLVLITNTLLLMDIAFLPFAAAVLAEAFHAGNGQRSAVVFYGLTLELAAILFNVIWEYARHDRRLLTENINDVGARSIARRYRLALVWIATGTALGGMNPFLGVAVIAAFIPFYWLPIRGETARPDRVGKASPR